MDEIRGFCVRMLGDGEAAVAAERAAHAAGDGDRTAALAAAVATCRERDAGAGPGATAGGRRAAAGGDGDLAAAVARELRAATDALPERQREALALRELLDLSYDDVARVVGVEPAAVAPLLARARLRLRAELRGEPETPTTCPEHDRALRTIALRQDGQPVPAADDDWLLEHLGHCAGCGRAHAAMLEASACYRAWR
jgi:hypothetical protein